ncbi:vitamin K epoxide reductase family protein [Gulosibacter sp. 10]|uniref:vitamin K epoxide reductase family protein n=1 Tax=Gulosibacter sp. 10 TaxID=1255570 RepID=UPI00097E816F|nr:vitamin K epoxide reductase family protein [Gulosibacter sp. 10]SJM54572.1 PROBABLE CONSERVED INTEGRAL MEMBRANE PROTEIN [Gulosibacter sp. 10]
MDTGPKTGEVETAEPLPSLYGNRGLGWVLLIGGGIGLLASFMLTIEYIHSLTEPDAQLLCDVNVFVTCQPAMNSSAGAILGFPNVILGLVSFTIAVVSGVVLLAGSALPRWYWIGLQVGLLGGAVLITYLQWYSGFQLRALCLWCMVIWTATIPTFALTTIGNLANGRLGRGGIRAGRGLAQWAWVVIVVWYLAVIGLVLAGMWDIIRLSMI